MNLWITKSDIPSRFGSSFQFLNWINKSQEVDRWTFFVTERKPCHPNCKIQVSG
jgi:hypothetical protein